MIPNQICKLTHWKGLKDHSKNIFFRFPPDFYKKCSTLLNTFCFNNMNYDNFGSHKYICLINIYYGFYFELSFVKCFVITKILKNVKQWNFSDLKKDKNVRRYSYFCNLRYLDIIIFDIWYSRIQSLKNEKSKDYNSRDYRRFKSWIISSK